MTITDYGWEIYHRLHDDHEVVDGSEPGRIITQSSQLSRVVTDSGENWSILQGSLMNKISSRSEYPAVGDWVLVDTNSQLQQWIIRKILPRGPSLIRKVAGVETEEQILAANIDWVFLVAGLDGGRNFNLRSIERYLTIGWESGAIPVLVLNKSDLCEDVDAAVISAESVAPGVSVHAVSCMTGEGIESLRTYLSPGTTVVLTGLSGVGKSSLINSLYGEGLLDTGPQRDADHRGRHTTTRRELVRLPAGALLIDTPGLRELQLWGDEESLSSSFPEIDELAAQCKFNDCGHTGEPGCAVQHALATGELEHSRYESYLDLQRELRYLKSKQDVRLRKQQQARGKEIAKFSRERSRALNRERSKMG